MENSILVVGGGVAGLAAARALSRAGRPVEILEARDRLGGRVLTLQKESPLELGPEFVHGEPPELLQWLRQAGLTARVLPDRHWEYKEGRLRPLPDFWEQLSDVTKEIDPDARDTSFADLLKHAAVPRHEKALAAAYVEGFHAAPQADASSRAIACNEESSEEINGQKQHKVLEGYGRLVEWMEAECRERGVRIWRGTRVRRLRWERGQVTAEVIREGREHEHHGAAAVISLPIGVLQSGAVEFDPMLDGEKLEAIGKLGSGAVVKAIFEFNTRVWLERDFGFIHSYEPWFPTWWAEREGHLLTAWAGGTQAQALAGRPLDFLRERGIETLARILGEKPAKLRSSLTQVYAHDWSADEFSRGAYSYIRVGGTDAPSILAKPLEKTLFFAGEATDLDHQFGTVHGALKSGLRAAREILE